MELSIIVGGDLVPTKSNYTLFKNADTLKLFGKDLCAVLQNSDIRIFNLEVPLTDNPTPIQKTGPNMMIPPYTINGIKAINPTLLGLANNHILDQGEQGLRSTIDILENNHILYAGAGANAQKANKPRVLTVDSKRIGVYCCAEREWTIATESSAGANPFDVYLTFEHLRAVKEVCDYLIVLYHGGKEYYRYPSPNLQLRSRKMIESGADLIVCQHSHCIGCEEDYHGGKIIYGQGNFISDYNTNDAVNEFWNVGLLIKINLKDDGITCINYIPIQKTANTICIVKGDDGENILDAFYKRSDEIKDNSFIKKNYEILTYTTLHTYLLNMIPVKSLRVVLRILKKLFGNKVFYKIYPKKLLLFILNIVRCETHRELFLAGLETIIKNDTDK